MPNVLFVGNSFTARNDVPAIVARLAAARGIDVRHTLVSAGGASLRMHLNKGEVQRRLDAERFDWVVLQEQSTLPIKNAKRFHENVRELDALVRAHGARTALYMTWARAHAPDTQRTLTDAYDAIGAERDARVVPAGEAWARALAEPDAPVLHDADGSHPTLAGSYLAACCFLPVLFDANPLGAESRAEGLDTKMVARLQSIALQTVRSRA